MEQPPLNLFNAPHNQWPHWIVQGIIDLFQTVFPDRLRAVYLMGSRQEETAASVSDIDGVIIFKEHFTNNDEREQAEAILTHCRLISPLRLDLELLAEDAPKLTTDVRDVRIKLGGELIYGEDMRDAIPLPQLAIYQAHLREWVQYFLRGIHDGADLVYPLSYPAADDEFFGYARQRAVPWYPATITSGTKELIAALCWVATTRLACEYECFVANRGQAVALAEAHLPAPWGDYVAAAYRHCKQEWDYQVPQEAAARQQLRTYCAEALHFFNDYLQRHGTR